MGTKWTRNQRLLLASMVVTVLLALASWLRSSPKVEVRRGGDGGSIVIQGPGSIQAGNGGPNGQRGRDVVIRAGDGGSVSER